jgi:hypothetical protein
MKFCPVVPEICRGQVHGPRKERRRKRRIIINNNKNNKSSKLCLGDLINNQTLSNDWLTYCHMGLYARKK